MQHKVSFLVFQTSLLFKPGIINEPKAIGLMWEFTFFLAGLSFTRSSGLDEHFIYFWL